MYIGLHVKYALLEKCQNIKFLDNTSSESRVVHADRQTDTRDEANLRKAPKNVTKEVRYGHLWNVMRCCCKVM
jgi:hypothetical protein